MALQYLSRQGASKAMSPLREALECAEYALSHPESDQAFALAAVRDALATPASETEKLPTKIGKLIEQLQKYALFNESQRAYNLLEWKAVAFEQRRIIAELEAALKQRRIIAELEAALKADRQGR
jgi:hypothetical protein